MASGFLFIANLSYAVFLRRIRNTTPIRAAALTPTRATGRTGEVVGCACSELSVTAVGPPQPIVERASIRNDCLPDLTIPLS